jgi:hypothetical protein
LQNIWIWVFARQQSYPSSKWSDDDYDVFDGERHVGRIMWTHAASREEATADFKSAWERSKKTAPVRTRVCAVDGGF